MTPHPQGVSARLFSTVLLASLVLFGLLFDRMARSVAVADPVLLVALRLDTDIDSLPLAAPPKKEGLPRIVRSRP